MFKAVRVCTLQKQAQPHIQSALSITMRVKSLLFVISPWLQIASSARSSSALLRGHDEGQFPILAQQQNIFTRHDKNEMRKRGSFSKKSSTKRSIEGSSPPTVQETPAFCMLDADSLAFANQVMRRNVTDINQFLDENDIVVDELRGFVSLVNSRIPEELLVSDRNILEAIMVQNEPDRRNLLFDLDSALDDRSLIDFDIDCITAQISHYANIVGTVLSFISPALASSSRRIGTVIANRLFENNSRLLRFSSFLLKGGDDSDSISKVIGFFIRIARRVSVANVLDAISEELDFAEWLILGTTLLLELVAVLASGTQYALIAYAARTIVFLINLSTIRDSSLKVERECTETASPTLSPNIFAPVDFPAFSPFSPLPPVRGPGFQSGVFGDPHVSTFDRLRFDCQAQGIFTMLTSLEDSSFVIQERFTNAGSNACSQASVSTGIAIREVDLPMIQVSIPRSGLAATNTLLNGCPIDLLIDGRPTDLSTGFSDPKVEVSATSNSIRVVYPETGLEISTSVRISSSFGCFFLVQIFLPFDYRQGETLIGLLGKPNGNRGDDWVDPSGSSYAPPVNQEQSIFSDAYNYCVENWCVQEEINSIFTFQPGETFDDANRCNDDYSTEIETAIANASPELRSVCQDDVFCFVDGICGGLVDALMAIQDEEIVKEAQEGTAPVSFPSPSPSTPIPSPSRLPSSLPTATVSLPSSFPSTTSSPSQTPTTFPSRMPSSLPTPSGKGQSKAKSSKKVVSP